MRSMSSVLAFAFQPFVSTPIAYWLSVWSTSGSCRGRRPCSARRIAVSSAMLFVALAEVRVRLDALAAGRDERSSRARPGPDCPCTRRPCRRSTHPSEHLAWFGAAAAFEALFGRRRLGFRLRSSSRGHARVVREDRRVARRDEVPRAGACTPASPSAL